MCIRDRDMKAWRDYLPHFPSAWINAYDADLKIKSAELYDLKAIPTLYLLVIPGAATSTL